MNSNYQDIFDVASDENEFNINTISLRSTNINNNDDQNNQKEYENISLDDNLSKNLSIMSLGNSINDHLFSFKNKTQLLLSSLQVTQIDPNFTNSIKETQSLFSLFTEIKLSSSMYMYNNSKANFFYKEYARILNSVFKDSKYDKQLFSKYIKTFTYFSTTKNFAPITYNEQKYTSDHLWGSLIRVYQMVLAKFFLDIQIQHFVTKTLKIDINHRAINPIHLYIDDATFSQLKYEMLLLFTDNPILISNLLNIEYFDSFIKQMPSLLQEYTQQELDEERDSFIVNKVLAPFSIGLIANCYRLILTQTSSFELKMELNSSLMVEIIKEIIEQFSLFNKRIEVLLFDSFISEEVIMNKCFVKFNDYICLEDVNKYNINQTIQYKEREFSLKEGMNALLFVEITLGENEIASDYQSIVTEVFKIRNNLGFIGCLKKSQSFIYFIGETRGRLIGLNPNKCRNAVMDIKDYLNYETFASFQPNSSNVTLMSLRDIGPRLVLCFQFKSIMEYKDLVSDLKKHSSLEKKLFVFDGDTIVDNSNYKNDVIEFENNNPDSISDSL